ncbi:MAG: hypothetical protein HJJLKODD_02023 [Phycisphaerae bacterium]|nr:hypothetical protein [Phycisphaerae bacterium]
MCTVTIIPPIGAADPLVVPNGLLGGGWRLMSNRDEQRSRPAGLPPDIRQYHQTAAAMPIDPVGGGTWIAVNQNGMVLTLLNSNPISAYTPQARQLRWNRRSRGTIIPQLIHLSNMAEAVAAADSLSVADYPPFRLLITDGAELCEIVSDGADRRLQRRAINEQPQFFTSSGLGDALVDGPRRELFTRYFAEAGDWLAKQEQFHRHHWPERPELSVCMRRADACTVSCTVIDVLPQEVIMRYYPGAPDEPVTPSVMQFPRVMIRPPCPS